MELEHDAPIAPAARTPEPSLAAASITPPVETAADRQERPVQELIKGGPEMLDTLLNVGRDTLSRVDKLREEHLNARSVAIRPQIGLLEKQIAGSLAPVETNWLARLGFSSDQNPCTTPNQLDALEARCSELVCEAVKMRELSKQILGRLEPDLTQLDAMVAAGRILLEQRCSALEGGIPGSELEKLHRDQQDTELFDSKNMLSLLEEGRHNAYRFAENLIRSERFYMEAGGRLKSMIVNDLAKVKEHLMEDFT